MIDQYKQQLDNMMQHEVDRGEFLKIVGVFLVGIVGVTGFFKNLREAVPSPTAKNKHSSAGGYGRSVYGR